MMVQEEMVRRVNLETGTGKRRIYGGKYTLSSIVYCARCGDVFPADPLERARQEEDRLAMHLPAAQKGHRD